MPSWPVRWPPLRRFVDGAPVAGTPNHYTATSAIRFAQVYLPDRLIDRVADGLRPGARMSGALRDDLIFRADGALEDMVDRYVAACLSGASALEQEARATLLVAALLRTHHGLAVRPPQARGGLAGWQLRRACEAMDARLDGAIGLEMLAGVAGCSPSHFSRAFKVSTGVAPFVWLQARRIDRAKALLEGSGLPLAEIALAVGFAAQPQFTAAFRRATGVTPGAWRRERRG